MTQTPGTADAVVKPYTVLRGAPGDERVAGTYESISAALAPIADELAKLRPSMVIMGPNARGIVRDDVRHVSVDESEVLVAGEDLEPWRVLIDTGLLADDVDAMTLAALMDESLMRLVRKLGE